MGSRPVIGITPGLLRDRNKLALGKGYADGVLRAGGLAVVLPLCSEAEIAGELLDAVDGVLFSGGADVDARHFGEENRKCGGEIAPERDGFELLLAGMAIARKMPVLGICRGLQLLNIALGGTIYQDIAVCRPQEILLKHWQEAPDWYPVHDVRITAGSRIHGIYGTSRLGVNSYHHQAIKEPGKGLAVTAVTSDGTIEAIEGMGDSYLTAVQWHPELMWQEDPIHLKLFESFVAASAVTRSR